MNQKDRALRVGALAVGLAVLLRMICSGVLGDTLSVFAQPQLASFLIYSESGREPDDATEPPQTTAPSADPTDPSQSSDPTEPSTDPTQPPSPVIPSELPTFTADDAQYVSMNYGCSLRPDVTSLLTRKLSWDLTGDEPTVLIIHTHGTEAYTPTADTQYQEFGGAYRTKDDRYNLISIGDELARLLGEAGISVIHDRTQHDLDDYNDSYENSRVAVQEYLRKYPSIKMVLDMHRDAAEYADGTQWATSATVDGKASAQVMLVVGTNASGLNHPNWQTNLGLATKINVMMERICPGVARSINLRSARFNQDLSTGALIAEIGSAGNTHEEALNAIPVLAEAILALVKGSQ